MDPITILSTIGTAGAVFNSCSSLAFQLYTFIENTSNVSQAVIDLDKEISGLTSALEAVKLSIASEPVKRAELHADPEESRLLWISTDGALKSCETTINRLEQMLVDVRPEGSNFAAQAMRRFRLNLKDSEIISFRAQIQTHTGALQIILQTVNLRATCITSGAVTNELLPKVDELKAIMELVYGRRTDLRFKSLGIEPEPEYLSGLKRSAQKVITSATTVSGSSRGSETTGSIFGEGMDEEKRNTMLSWIPEPVVYEEDDQPSTTAPLSEDYALSHTTAPTTYTTSDAGAAESDSDEDLQAEMVEACFARGIKKFNEKSYTEAQSALKRGLQLTNKLPINRRSTDKIAEVKLMIAESVYYSPNLAEAESRLYEITQEKNHEDITDEGAIRRCKASHLLAGVLFRKSQYGLATTFCRNALTGRRRVLGKTHISCYESLSLLSQICEANGLQEDAETYLEMIPEDVRSTLVSIKDQFPGLVLKTREAAPARPTSLPVPTRASQSVSRMQSTSPSSPRSISPRLSHVVPYQTSSATGTQQYSASTGTLTSTLTAASSNDETLVEKSRKRSFFKSNPFSRRKSSIASSLDTASLDDGVDESKELTTTGTAQQSRPLPVRRDTAGSGSANRKPSFQEFLEHVYEREGVKDEGNHWPGLN